MRSSASSNVVIAAVVAGLCAASAGCSTPAETGGTGGNPFGTAGTPAVGMGGTPATVGGAGVTAGSGTVAGSASGGASGSGTGGVAPVGGNGAMSGSGGGGAGPVGGAITAVVPSGGCGKAYAGQTGGNKNTIQTSGTKDADCAAHLNGQPKCGAWSTPRDYYVYLPENYDMNKAYNLIFVGPGCGGQGTDIYPYNNNVDNTAIRVGITPGPNSLGHGTNENQGCFDDKEGDDSIDWVLYENLYDKLNAEGGVCFDRNRVFAGGNSSGAWFSNELGCKYAGDAMRPVRGIFPNTGGLPMEEAFSPTCTNSPMSGMWIHGTGDTTNPFTGNKFAIQRAMTHNSCTTATSWDDAVAKGAVANYPIGGHQPADTCKLITGCDPLYPIVVCALNLNDHGGHDNVVNPAVSTYVKAFSAPPLGGL